eukprot:scaffold302799_cov41-Tisochrysis_lutea.AAC.2
MFFLLNRTVRLTRAFIKRQTSARQPRRRVGRRAYTYMQTYNRSVIINYYYVLVQHLSKAARVHRPASDGVASLLGMFRNCVHPSHHLSPVHSDSFKQK